MFAFFIAVSIAVSNVSPLQQPRQTLAGSHDARRSSATFLESASQSTSQAADPAPKPGSLGEAAGIKFAERQWDEAIRLALQAVAEDPTDRYAWDVLGSSYYMQDRLVPALDAWNHIDKPRIALIEVDGTRRMRARTVTDTLDLETDRLLTAYDFLLANRRLEELPDRSASRLDYRPDANGAAGVLVNLVERSWQPRGWAEWFATGLETVVQREFEGKWPGPGGDGGLWSGSWRWWSNRPRVALSYEAPSFGRLAPRGSVWHVDTSWEQQAYGLTETDVLRQTHVHAAVRLTNWATPDTRYAISGGIDHWQGPFTQDVRASFLGGSLERRWDNDRWSMSGDTALWLPSGDQPAFTRSALRAAFLSSPLSRGWVFSVQAGIEHASDNAPFGLWPGAGEGHVSSLLLRAHPLLDDGVIRLGRDSVFARTVTYSSSRAERWIGWSLPVRFAAAGFVDVAQAAERLTVDTEREPQPGGERLQVDVGAGIRLRVPGTMGTFRLDVARGLRDGANAITAGWEF